MIKNGIPFDVAHDLIDGGPESEVEIAAYVVVFGELEGGTFDWDRMKWKERNGNA